VPACHRLSESGQQINADAAIVQAQADEIATYQYLLTIASRLCHREEEAKNDAGFQEAYHLECAYPGCSNAPYLPPGGGVIYDYYSAMIVPINLKYPQAVWLGDSGDQTKVVSFDQSYSAGSEDAGEGKLLKEHVLNFRKGYADNE